MAKECQWLELRPFVIGARGNADTFARAVIITNATLIEQLGKEMSGSPYPQDVKGDHWICHKWLQLDFHLSTNTIGFVVGIHARHPVAMAQEICDYGWQGWHSYQEGAKSGSLPDLLEEIRASNDIEWVGADEQHVGRMHYAVPASAYPPGDSRSGIGDVLHRTPDPSPIRTTKQIEPTSPGDVATRAAPEK